MRLAAAAKISGVWPQRDSLASVSAPPSINAATASALRGSTGNERVSHILADFSSLAGVCQLAEQVWAEHDALHVLVNNAGLWNTERKLTVDGYEETFAVNHLAPFLLTRQLRPLIEKSAPARVVVVSSRRHQSAKPNAFDDLNLDRSYPRKGVAAYDRSKLANILFSSELARRLVGTGVTSNAVHPGPVATSIARGSFIARIGNKLLTPFLRTPAQGAATTLHVVSSDELTETTGKYFADCAEATPSAAARDPRAAERLWQLSEQIVAEYAAAPPATQ